MDPVDPDAITRYAERFHEEVELPYLERAEMRCRERNA